MYTIDSCHSQECRDEDLANTLLLARIFPDGFERHLRLTTPRFLGARRKRTILLDEHRLLSVLGARAYVTHRLEDAQGCDSSACDEATDIPRRIAGDYCEQVTRQGLAREPLIQQEGFECCYPDRLIVPLTEITISIVPDGRKPSSLPSIRDERPPIWWKD